MAAPKTRKDDEPVYRTYEDFPFDELCTYAGIDCLVTSQVLTKIFPMIAEKKSYTYSEQGVIRKGTAPAILDFMHDLEMPAHEFIIDMELNGIKYDVENNQRQCKLIEAELPELEDKVFSLLGRKLNLDSGKELAKLLYEDLGFEPPSFTKHNEPSVDGDALSSLAKTHDLEWLRVLARRNNLASVYRTFYRSYVQDFVKSDGRIHPNYNLFGTSSFRITGDYPNLTQLPNAVTEDRLGYSVRENFIVDQGNLFLCVDQSSAEVKILGALCRDPKLLRAIAEGKDFHSYSASSMYGIPYDEFVEALEYEGSDPAMQALRKKFKTMRQGSKALTFGILYGSSVKGIAYNLKITEDEAKRLIALYFKEFPLIEVYVKDSHNMALWNHYVINAFGQAKREFGAMNLFKNTAVYNAALRNAQNVRVQSTASGAGLYGFTRVNEVNKRLGAKSLCTVYDSLEQEIPYFKAAECVENVFYQMEEGLVEAFGWLELPVAVDLELGMDWANMVKIHRGITQPELEALLLKDLGIQRPNAG